jgi:hypothetical protein
MKPNRPREQPASNPDSTADLDLIEGTFAAQYLLKEHDLIPDQVTGMGLIDDAILIKRVFSRNEPKFMRLEMLLEIASSPENRNHTLAYETGFKANPALGSTTRHLESFWKAGDN